MNRQEKLAHYREDLQAKLKACQPNNKFLSLRFGPHLAPQIYQEAARLCVVEALEKEIAEVENDMRQLGLKFEP